ncbi:hypothetical protein M8J75_009105 [Diaphorina citri]|nr:hypothetical protein M8J75_009105 [Diaphorina citri]KAI5728980.1 hypothetical protein M8J77_023883 [Diaphorina citri]
MEIDNNDSTATNNNKAYVPAAISKSEHYKPLCEDKPHLDKSLQETYLKAFFQHPPNTPTVAAEHHTHNHHVCSKQHTPQHNLTYYKS